MWSPWVQSKVITLSKENNNRLLFLLILEKRLITLNVITLSGFRCTIELEWTRTLVKDRKDNFSLFFADETLFLLLIMIRWQKSLLTSNEKNLLHPLLPSFIITTEIGCNLSHWKVLIKGLCILLTRKSERSILIYENGNFRY